MGISLQAWRQAIGMFNNAACKNPHAASRQSCGLTSSEASCLFLLLSWLLLVFCFNVECSSLHAIVNFVTALEVFSFLSSVPYLVNIAPSCKQRRKSSSESKLCHLEPGDECLEPCCLFFMLLVIVPLLIIGGIEKNPGPPFKCKSCNFTSVSLNDFGRHQRDVHSMDRNFLFSCPVCQYQIFCNYSALKVHISKFHRSTASGRCEDVGEKNIPCTSKNCMSRVASLKDLCDHLISVHGKVGELIICPFPCESGPLKLTSFRVHLSSYHPGWRFKTEVLQADPEHPEANMSCSFDEPNDDCNLSGNGSGLGADHDTSRESDGADDEESQNFYHKVAKFYLKMESECMLAASTIQTMSEGLADLLYQNLSCMKKAILKELKDLSISEEDTARILTNILCADKLYCVHAQEAPGPLLTTIQRRRTYYKKNFNYVEHKEVNLSEDPEDRRCVFLFPVDEQLEVLLACPSVKKQMDASFKRQQDRQAGVISDPLSDYTDGLVYLNGKFAKEETIDLFVFQDSFNPLKDLSSVADEYDTLGVYMTLGNLKFHTRSRLQSIHPAMLIPKFKNIWSDFREKCFSPLIEDLKKLEQEGIMYNGQNLRVVVQFCVGDNKGQNQIGGFVESFTASEYCRFCPISKQEFLSQPWKLRNLRTKEDVARDLQEFTERASQGEDIAHVNGVKSVCPFNELQNFEATDPRLAPCLAHDIFEGIVDKYDMVEILNHFVNEGWFSLKTLNKLIKKFPYSAQDLKNKPAKVKISKVGGHAVQNWTLLRYLPLILGKQRILDTSDPYWLLYLDLKEICEYVCAPSITRQQIAELRGLVEDYLFTRQNVLGINAKPKHHFLNHYADLIVYMGPLIHLFTLRFESMHKFFKTCARTSKNVINLGVTMCEKASLYFCYLSTGFFIHEGTMYSGARRLDIAKFKQPLQDVFSAQKFSPEVVEVDRVTVDCLTFTKGDWILLSNDDEDGISVGLIKCIVADAGSIKICIQCHYAKRLTKYGIFSIDQDESSVGYKLFDTTELKYPVAQPVYNFDGQLCFTLRHILSGL